MMYRTTSFRYCNPLLCHSNTRKEAILLRFAGRTEKVLQPLNPSSLEGTPSYILSYAASRCFFFATRSNTTVSNNNNNPIVLHHEWINKKNDNNNDKERPILVFLHGLLGNGRNLKTFARKLCEQSNSNGLLLDLRGHGKSKQQEDKQAHSATVSTIGDNDRSASTTPTFDIFIQDIQHTLEKILGFNGQNLSIPVSSSSYGYNPNSITLIGHSLGGRLALQLAATTAAARASGDDRQCVVRPQRVWLLDTVPGKPDESVERVIRTITELSDELSTITSRKQLVERLTNQKGLEMGLAQWLASSTIEKDNVLEFVFDLQIANKLLDDFKKQDFYSLIHEATSSTSNNNDDGTIRVDLVCAGNNKAWLEPIKDGGKDVLTSVKDIESSNFQTHVLTNAGHWVHIDNLPDLLKIFSLS